jgi:pimeloyl-ACP methyl ester carboxylesterase
MLIQGPTGSVHAADFPGRQGRLVFASLALTSQPLLRETLADRVWRDQLPKAWERDLSTVVSKLRALLVGVGLGGREVITTVSTAYQLRLPPEVQTDVARAGELASAAEAALRAGDFAPAVELASEVAAVANRPFLPGEDAPWIDEVRGGLRQLHQRALEAAATGESHLGHHSEALRLAEQALALDPFRESAYRLLMQIHLDLGDRAQAVAAYERCRRLLADELGLDPSPQTQALHLTALRASAPATRTIPKIQYTRSGRVSIAYQEIGEGPIDLVLVPGWISNLELAWEEPRMAGFLRRLGSMARLIMFDKRGTGLSDPIPLDAPPDLEVRMDDVRAVMDAVESRRAVLFGFSEGGAMSLLFAASHPDRTLGLVLWGSWVRQRPGPNFPLGWSREEGLRRFVRPIQETGTVDSRWFAPSVAGEPEFERWFRRYARHSASPGMAIALLRANAAMDVRPVLPAVRVPSLVLQRTDDVLVEVGHGRYLAEHLPGTRYTELAGRDHWPWLGDSSAVLDQIAQFLVELTPGPVSDEILATVVAVRPGAGSDRLREYRGVLVSASREELVAHFDGPARAMRFAAELAREGAQAGVHTGLVVLPGRGLTVQVACELAGLAPPGEVLLTRAVADLVAGSGLRLAERGEVELPGIPGAWPLLAGA